LKTLTIIKFGGGLIDFAGTNIPLIVERITELKKANDLGPLAVFSAPKGVTDRLQTIGEASALGRDYDLDFIFSSYSNLASHIVKTNLLEEFESLLDRYRNDIEETLSKVDRRFNGPIRARVLTSGGELPTATLMSYALNSIGLQSCSLDKTAWPIITDDNFENATPDFEMSRKKLSGLIHYIEEKRVISVGGFMGMTHDGLETLLGRGGSDQTAVFLSILLRDHYEIETILFKETPVRSADPEIVRDQPLRRVSSMTYNEAQKATISGMTIVQNAAVRIAQLHKLPVTVAPLSDLRLGTLIQTEDPTPQAVKCVTGLTNCAIITMSNERSRSLQDCLVLWEDYDAFLDLGAEVMDTGQVLRDFLVLDANFVRKNEERLRSFDKEMKVEYGLGVVTLVGDKMRDTPGIASIAISSIPRINIKRGIFAPHTSQIILVVKEADIFDAIREIHRQLDSKGYFRETTNS
jgi:aspartate kinase